jgi:hypothetical protein
METFDTYEFECMLQNDFFSGNDLEDIAELITFKKKNDPEFAKQYKIWTQVSEFSTWRKFYNELKREEKAAWEMMFPDGDEDDAITDYMTKE